MALPSATIIALAKAYAYRLERGYTPQQAQEYIRDNFPSRPYERRAAVYQAQRAIAVGAVIEGMGLDEQLGEALEGRRPAPTVGVRVQLTRFGVQRDNVYSRDERHDLYIEVSWDASKRDVLHIAREWFANHQHGSGPAVAWELHFVGPTLWPGHSPGLALEG